MSNLGDEARILNIERSFNVFFRDRFENVYLPPVTVNGEERPRVSYDNDELVVDGLNEWVQVHFLGFGEGVAARIPFQITVSTVRSEDPYKTT